MPVEHEKIYDELYSYCKNKDFAGFDPFDGLNSRLFSALPLKQFAPARLAWLQMVKRSAFDLRSVLKVEKGVNPKALALFALAELSRFRVTRDERHAENAKGVLTKLLSTGNLGNSTLAFGYNFDWQSRHFFAPAGTPAIVPTAFASQAFIEAYELFGDKKYLIAAGEICEFITGDLTRPVETGDELCFSYTPLDNTIIFNASLLAGESLARFGAIAERHDYLEMAAKTMRFVVSRQRSDGAWTYGENAKQSWIDNFHTAYVLLSLNRISTLVPEIESGDAIRRGINFWLENFFLDDGTPKYYDNSIYPVDIHSAAVAISSLCELAPLDKRLLPMARNTAAWTIANMRDDAGYFYYQRRKTRVVKTPFVRWGQAWMAYALARLIEADE